MNDSSKKSVYSIVRFGSTILFLAGLVAVSGGVAHAQRFSWPENPKNIQALPETISSHELSAAMRSFTRSLGVRCSFCHVGEEGASLADFDFESDDKVEKRTAREMIRMVQAINKTHLAGLENENPMRVTCVTCHRGIKKPYMIGDVLAKTLKEDGLDAAVEEYLDLKARYQSSFTYDFTERALDRFATGLLNSEEPEAALAFYRLNTDLNPSSAQAWSSIARAYEAAGDTVRAITLYQHALVLEPQNNRVARALSKLK